MKLFKRHGMWHVEFYDTAGARKRVSTGVADKQPQSIAERAASARIQSHVTGNIRSGVQADRIGAVVNLAEALERTYVTRWKDTRSGGQIKHVVRRMEREIGHWLLREIDFNRLEEYQQDLLKRGKSKATANRRLSVLKVTLRHCHKKLDITSMPPFPETMDEDNVRERYLTVEEEQRVREFLSKRVRVEAIEGGREWVYVSGLFSFLLDTGCRLSEALKLKPLRNGVAHLEHGTTKSRKARTVPLTPRARTAAEALLASPLHGKVDANWVFRRWAHVRKACAIPDVNIHILRHTCASRLLERGVDIYTVSKWLGHSSVKVTERYAHLAQGALEQAAAALAGRPVAVGTPDAQPFHQREDSAAVGT